MVWFLADRTFQLRPGRPARGAAVPAGLRRGAPRRAPLRGPRRRGEARAGAGGAREARHR